MSVRAIVVGLVVVLFGASCAPPAGPVEIPTEDLPFDLARTPQTSPPAEPSPSLATVYFVRDGRLQPSTRVAREADRLSAAMQALLAGPNEEERQQGIDSAIPARTSLLEVEVVDRIAQVDLSAEFQGPAEPDQILLRIAQVVWTLVGLPGIGAVTFSIDGTPVSVVTGDRTTMERPVSASDFALVAPIGATPAFPSRAG